MRTHLHLVCAALAVLLAFAAPRAHAQGTTTAALTGVVSDATGEALPGATVTAVHTPSGTQYRAATRVDGGYDLRGLRVGGPYTVTATFIGLLDATETGIQLALGQTLTVDLTLAEAGSALGEVEVTANASAVVSRDRTGAATNVTASDIEALPSISRSIADFARLSPLSSGGGSSSFAGRNNRYNNIQVDGATLNDVFGLAGSGTPGGQAGTQPISIDAVEEFNVDVAPFDVRFSGFTGASVNAVTKSGTNDFRGSLRLLQRDQSFVGDLTNADGTSSPFGDFTEQTYVATLGGPILRNKLFFFLNGEVVRNRFPEDTGVFGTAATNVFNLGADAVQNVADIAQSVYGYDAGGFDPFTNSRDNVKVLGKVDWNISPRQRFSLRHNYVDASDDQGVNRSATSFNLRNGGYVFRSLQNSTTAQLNSTISPTISNEARLVYTAIRDQRDAGTNGFSQVFLFPDDINRIGLGTDRSSQANSLDQDLFEFTNNLTLFRGDHTVTLGTNNQAFSFNNVFVQDLYGSYEFRDLALGTVRLDTNGDGVGDVSGTLPAAEAFRYGLPTRYQLSYGSEYQIDGAGNLQYACTRSAGCTDAQLTPVRTVNTGVVPAAEFSGVQLGFYAQDEWQAMPDLRLTLGLRVDVPLFPDSPVENPLVSGTTGVRPDGTTFAIPAAFGEYSTTNTASGNPLVSPRLGVNYRLNALGGRPLQVRGGTGIFSGRSPYVWISNQYSNTGADLARLATNLTATSFDVDRNGVITQDEQGFFPGSNLPGDQPVPGQNAALVPFSTTTVNLIDPDFKFPQVFRTNLGLDQELGGGFVATLEGIYTKSVNEVSYRNLNLNQVGEDAYGRPLYGTIAGGRGTPSLVNPNFVDALLLENTNQGYEYNLVAQLQRQVRTGFGGSLSYTYNRARNINNVTSSVAQSNWRFNENVDVNNPGLGTADFEVRHRVLGYGTFRTEYAGRFSSQLAVILDSQAGEPFSYVYTNDGNGDGTTGNDLVFVPAKETDVFLTSGNYPLLDAFITSQPGLDDYRGTFTDRNANRASWQTRLDLEFTQGIETVRGQRIDFEATLLNLPSLLNSDWGRIRFTSNNAVQAYAIDRYIGEGEVGNRVSGRIVTTDDIGKPVISFNETTARSVLNDTLYGTASLASRWQLRFGVKYSF